MRCILCFTFIASLLSCNQTSKIQPEISEGQYVSLLSKYREISFDTLKVFSSADPENNKYKFKGIQLDSLDVSMFPKDIVEMYSLNDGFYGCYKFPIDNSTTGLITRTPSTDTYEPSSIKLFILDKKKNTINSYIELADVFADAGDYAEKTSWLFRNQKKNLNTLLWIQESHDNSVEDDNDTSVQKSNSYYLIDLSKQRVDTISKSEKDLTKEFKHLFRN